MASASNRQSKAYITLDDTPQKIGLEALSDYKREAAGGGGVLAT
jgi:hypothetical protein